MRPRPMLGPLLLLVRWVQLVRVRLYKDAFPPLAASWEEGLRQLAMSWVVKTIFFKSDPQYFWRVLKTLKMFFWGFGDITMKLMMNICNIHDEAIL